MALNTTFTSGQILTAAQMNNLPWGMAGKSELSLDKSFTTLTDSGLTVTWTAVASRQYKLSLFGNMTTTASSLVETFITDSANNPIREVLTSIPGGSLFPIDSFVFLSGVSGSVTYKVRVKSGTGTGTLYGTNSRSALLAVFLVEDIGAA